MSNSKLLVTSAGPNMLPVMEKYSLPTFERFAEMHDYDLHVEPLQEDSSARDERAKQARWQKIPILRKMLERGEHDLVVWIDGDILICRDDKDIAEDIHPDSFQAMPLESYPAEHRVNPTTSIWAMRNTEESMRFLQEAEDMGVQPGPWADQGVVLPLLGWDVGDENYHWAKPGRGSEYLTRTSWLPDAWNQSYLSTRTHPRYFEDRPVVENPSAIHFHGMTVDERLLAMSTVCQALGYTHENDGIVAPLQLVRPIPRESFLRPDVAAVAQSA
jgi:hypothetical protein